MIRRVSLPVLPAVDASPAPAADGPPRPDVDAARRSLGGRGTADGPLGEVVYLEHSPERAGVVLFTAGDRADVWHPPGTVRRTSRAALRPVQAIPPELAAAAASVRRFAALAEGARLTWTDAEGGQREGRLAEKCRFGALVVDDAGALLALGFQRVALATLPDLE